MAKGNEIVEIRIGVQHCPRELTFESDQEAALVEVEVARATQTGEMLRLQDSKGATVCVRGSAIGYVEIGASRKGGVGFGML